MLKYFNLLAAVLFCSHLFPGNPLKSGLSAKITFKENKGQVSDQFYQPRPDVLFSANDNNITYHFKKDGVSYQLNKVSKWQKNNADKNLPEIMRRHLRDSSAAEMLFYRIDINWLNVNTNPAITKGFETEGYDNYYLESCPQGALNVKSYQQITYQQIYPGIDLKWYSKNGNLKYDYVIAAGVDYKQIQLEIKGAESITLSKNGDLILITPLGEITEEAPLVLQNGKKLEAKWVIKNNIVSFGIKNADPALPLVIDPMVRLWGTFFGGAGQDEGWFVNTDINNNVYLSGQTESLANIATVGSQQTIYGGVGPYWGDAFLAKFDPAGTRIWSTYYGGIGQDFGCKSVSDALGNVFLVGGTTGTNSAVIATPGAHQTTPSGGAFGNGTDDAFLVKFNSAGVRQWGTFYGGAGCEWAEGVDLDASGNIYMTGGTTSQTAIVTAGAHQTVIGVYFDGFLVKFNPAGVRQWGTYYGGNAYDNGQSCRTDFAGNIYLTGVTLSSNSIAISSLGSHQPSYGGGGGDGYLAKFDSNGNRQWATYYGGTGNDWLGHFCLDAGGNLYLPGGSGTSSGTIIATPGTHQSIYGGGTFDAFLVKFNPSGNRIWSTYYGGSGNDVAYSSSIDNNGNIYLSGHTSTSGGTAIATPCTYQTNYGGGITDAFLAKFTSNGLRVWGTYYGGPGKEDNNFWSNANTCDASGNVYLTGATTSGSGTIMASPGSYQPFNGGISDAFLAKFNGCVPIPPPNTTSPQNMTVCVGESTSLTTSNTSCGINWLSSPGGNVIGTGSMITTPSLSANTNFYLEDLSCGSSNTLTQITVTVIPLPDISIRANTTVVCTADPVNLSAGGATNYTWIPTGQNTPSITVNPGTNTSYSLIGNNGQCTNTAVISVEVVEKPNVFLNYGSSRVCYGSSVSILAFGAQTYTWFPINNLSMVNGSVVSTNTLGANSNFTVIGSNNNGTVSCLNQATLNVQVFPQIIPSVSNSVIICEGNRAVLNAGGASDYHWFPESTISEPNRAGVTANPDVSTIYTVNISYNELCMATSTVFVKVEPRPRVNAGRDTVINYGDPVFINASGDGVLKWISGENIECRDCPFTNVHPLTKSCYLVQATDENGCTAQDEVCVEVKNDYDVFVPNTFTPNDDGINDILYVFGFGVKAIKLTIFDKWGQLLFSSNSQLTGWDGYYNGEMCKQDTYVYRLEYTPYRGNSAVKSGHVNIIR